MSESKNGQLAIYIVQTIFDLNLSSHNHLTFISKLIHEITVYSKSSQNKECQWYNSRDLRDRGWLR